MHNPAPRTFVQSKDGQRAIVVDLDDALHLLCWGRLLSTNVPITGAVAMAPEQAREWIVRERQVVLGAPPLPITSPYHPDYDLRGAA